MKRYIRAVDTSDEYMDEDMDIQQMDQEYTSEKTSINVSKVPAVFKEVKHWRPGTINIDYGGGRADTAADYLTQFDVINLVYDPYNRTPEHNKEVIRTVRKAGGADTATCSNVLNVIKEPEVRQNVLQNIKKLVKPNGTVYITVYEGSGKNNEGPTKSGYQLNRKTEGYLDEIKQVFPDAVRKGKLIVAHPNGSAVTSAEDLSYDALTCEDCTYDLWTLVQDDSGKWVREDKIDTYDDYDTAETVAEALAKDTPCQLVEVGPNGLSLVWTSKVSDPAIIEWLHDEYTMGNTKYSELAADLMNTFSLSNDEAYRFISDWMDEDTDVHLEYDEDIDASTDVVKGASGRKHSIKALHDALLNKASQVMRMQGFPLNEIADYLVVDIQPTEDGWLNCEVRAELSYEGMSEMIDALNPIVQKYDKDAYFDHVTGGIISAYLPGNKFNVLGSKAIEAANDYPEPSLEPSYSSEPQERTTKQEIIINIDDDILVDASTDDVDFIGDPSFLDDDETWVAEDESMFRIAEPDEVYEHVMDLIIDRIPMSTGKYHVRGSVKLVYDLTLLYIDDSTGPEDQHSELDVDASESRYDPYTSEVIELDVTQQ